MSAMGKIRAALDLKTLELPEKPRIVAVEVEEYVDWYGDDALRVWVILAEEEDVAQISGKAVLALKNKIHESLLKDGIKAFPYISLLKASERIVSVDEE